MGHVVRVVKVGGRQGRGEKGLVVRVGLGSGLKNRGKTVSGRRGRRVVGIVRFVRVVKVSGRQGR